MKEGDRYLVEAGCGFPSFEAVRIDDLGHGGFEQIFQDSFHGIYFETIVGPLYDFKGTLKGTLF